MRGSYLRGAWDDAARLYGTGFRQFAAAGLLPALVVPLIARWASHRGLAISIAVGVAAFATTLVAPAAMIALAGARLHDKHLGIGRAYVVALRRVLTIVGTALVVGFVVLIPFVIVVSILAAVNVRGAPLILATLVTMFFLTLRFQLVLPAIVFAKLGPFRAVGRSWTLVRGATFAFAPFALAAFIGELVPNIAAGFLDGTLAAQAIGVALMVVAFPVSAVALTVAYDRLIALQRSASLSWIPDDELAGFAATAERRQAAIGDERPRRLGWRHLLLLPTLASLVGLALGKDWGDLLFLLGLPCLVALGLWAAVARMLAADY